MVWFPRVEDLSSVSFLFSPQADASNMRLSSDPIPAISVIIANWNGARVLPRCLAALSAQTFTNYEIILVDNASDDHSADGLEARYAKLQVIRLAQNLGFAAANNIGARAARGEWLALLNNDAFPHPDWLVQLVTVAHDYPERAFFASRLVRADDHARLDGEGDVYHVSGLAWRRNHNRNIAEASDEIQEVFSACAAAALYPRQAFLQVGGFDEDFFSYHEDIDLAFRLRLQGYRCLCVPCAVVEHIGSASYGERSDFAVYYGHRNLVWTFFKNMPTPLLWRYLPWHITANLFFLLYYSLRGQWRAISRSKIDALRGLRRVLNKRHAIQQSRQVSTEDLARVMDRGWSSPHLQIRSRL